VIEERRKLGLLAGKTNVAKRNITILPGMFGEDPMAMFGAMASSGA